MKLAKISIRLLSLQVQGMGEAFAKILALNGVTVVVCDFNASSAVANEIRSIGGEARPSLADVSNAETMSKIVRSVKVN